MFQKHSDPPAPFHFERLRLNNLFMHAINHQLIVICAGAGYGKTTAVHDFVRKFEATTVWVQLSERDNVGGRFWENFVHTMMQINPLFARAVSQLGFPDTAEKMNQYNTYIRDHSNRERSVIVFDDCHFIENPAVIRFVEYALRNMPQETSLILISRSTPNINIADLVSKNQVFNISEDELVFTENEIAQYFRSQGISLQPDNLRGIMQDTEGWAFAINLIIRSFNKAPAYEGYLRSAMKTNIFRFMNTNIWDTISEPLQRFLVRLSLIDHLSLDLISLLAGTDSNLIEELEKQNAYVRRDSYINAYLIHPLFLEFLATKQELLSEEERRETYTIAGEWCHKNDFKIDALSYYEKIGDYKSIAGLFIGSQSQIPYDVAGYAAAIFARTPPEVFDKVLFLPSIHMRTVMCQGLWEDVIKLAEYYEARYIKLPVDDDFRRLTLSSIYYCWGISRSLMCLSDDFYTFDQYYEKLDKCFTQPFDPGILINKNPGGAWICSVGSSRKGAPEEFLAAFKRSSEYLAHCYIDFETGKTELAEAEILFYKNDIEAAEANLARALLIAREKKQAGVLHRTLFYILRIAVLRGNYARAEQTIKEMRNNLTEEEYFNRFIDFDISLCWYYCTLGLPEKAPDWLKDDFSLYAHATFIENFANQMKARYFYMTRDYPILLSYIHDMKQRESFLFGRLEMLAFEACIHYKMKNKKKAYTTLEEAYQTASPNNLLMPFIELGKDMRTLTSSALKEPGSAIPRAWLEDVNRKSVSYAKRLAHVTSEYRQTNRLYGDIILSPREKDVLTDLSHGLSRSKIADSRNLSVNTVKMVINNIYSKLGAENMADAIRIATERKII